MLFFSQKNKNSIDKTRLSSEEYMRMLDEAYDDFTKRVRSLEEERDKRIAVILERIDKRGMQDILNKVSS